MTGCSVLWQGDSGSSTGPLLLATPPGRRTSMHCTSSSACWLTGRLIWAWARLTSPQASGATTKGETHLKAEKEDNLKHFFETECRIIGGEWGRERVRLFFEQQPTCVLLTDTWRPCTSHLWYPWHKSHIALRQLPHLCVNCVSTGEEFTCVTVSEFALFVTLMWNSESECLYCRCMCYIQGNCWCLTFKGIATLALSFTPQPTPEIHMYNNLHVFTTILPPSPDPHSQRPIKKYLKH